MPNPLTDKIDMADAGVKIGLLCAQCGEKVLSNQTHECPVFCLWSINVDPGFEHHPVADINKCSLLPGHSGDHLSLGGVRFGKENARPINIGKGLKKEKEQGK